MTADLPVASLWYRRYRVARRCDNKLVLQVWRLWVPWYRVVAVVADSDSAYAAALMHSAWGKYCPIYQL